MAARSILRRLLAGSGEAQGVERHVIRLSAPLLAGLGLVLVCAVGWAFFMGFMVGRGQSPHEELHAMTGGMIDSPARQKVLQPPEEDAAEAQPPMPQDAAEAPPAIATAPPVRPAEGQQRPKKEEKPPVNAAAARKFVYAFQVAAFKTRAEAESLQKKLNAKGVKTSLGKSGKVYLLTTTLRGTGKDVEKLSATLKKLKLGKPLQLSRKMADTPKKPKKQDKS